MMHDPSNQTLLVEYMVADHYLDKGFPDAHVLKTYCAFFHVLVPLYLPEKLVNVFINLVLFDTDEDLCGYHDDDGDNDK